MVYDVTVLDRKGEEKVRAARLMMYKSENMEFYEVGNEIESLVNRKPRHFNTLST